MSLGSYDVEINDKIRTIDMLEAQRSNGKRPEFIKPPERRSKGMLTLDCFTAFLILLLPATFLHSTELFLVNLAAVLGIVLAVYYKIVWMIMVAVGPPDSPHVIAIIKAPDKLYCPRCGAPKTQKHCSACGANVEKEYRKLVRQLAWYAVEDTKQQREFLELSLKGYLQQVTQKQQQEIVVALEKMERNYVMEIVRQKKELRQLQRGRLEGRGSDDLQVSADDIGEGKMGQS
jgi:hypothetical protein